MQQFINDLINLTQGQIFIKYWWLGIVLIPSIYVLISWIDSKTQ